MYKWLGFRDFKIFNQALLANNHEEAGELFG